MPRWAKRNECPPSFHSISHSFLFLLCRFKGHFWWVDDLGVAVSRGGVFCPSSFPVTFHRHLPYSQRDTPRTLKSRAKIPLYPACASVVSSRAPLYLGTFYNCTFPTCNIIWYRLLVYLHHRATFTNKHWTHRTRGKHNQNIVNPIYTYKHLTVTV